MCRPIAIWLLFAAKYLYQCFHYCTYTTHLYEQPPIPLQINAKEVNSLCGPFSARLLHNYSSDLLLDSSLNSNNYFCPHQCRRDFNVVYYLCGKSNPQTALDGSDVKNIFRSTNISQDASQLDFTEKSSSINWGSIH